MPAATRDERRRTSPDPDATTALGIAFGRVAQAGDVLCLWGDLGAGKTHLAKAIGAGLGVSLVEWPDRLGPALPARRLDVVIDGSGDEPREITVRAVGDAFGRYLDAV